MPEADCFCAICGACIRAFAIGSRSAKAKRVRGIVLRNAHRKRARTRLEMLELPRERSESPFEEISESDFASARDGDEGPFDYANSYDPEVLEGHDTSWIPEVLLIANDPHRKRTPRTFICGPAHFDDNGYCLNTFGQGEQFDVMDYDCARLPLYDYDELFHEENYGLGTYPCHVPCLKMLARAITGTTMDFHQLDPYVLHRSMHSIFYRNTCGSNFDYGEIEGSDQFWESYPGEEVRGYKMIVNYLAHNRLMQPR